LEAEMENIIIVREYEKFDKIDYPQELLSDDMHVEPIELSLPHVHGDCILFRDNGKFRDRGYDVHHVQSMAVAEFYVRGIIEHTGKDHVPRKYVFTARMQGLNVGKLDYDKLVEAAIEQLEFNTGIREDEDGRK
jgi:hypothetical protein